MLKFPTQTKCSDKPEQDSPKGKIRRICFYVLPEKAAKHIRYWLIPAVILSAYSLFYLNNPVASLTKINPIMGIGQFYAYYAVLLLLYGVICIGLNFFTANSVKTLLTTAKVLHFICLLTFIAPATMAAKNYIAIENEISDIQTIGDSVIEFHGNNGYFPTARMLIESSFIFRVYELQYNENIINCKLEHLTDNTVIITSASKADREHIAKQIDEYGFSFVYIALGEVIVVTDENLDKLDFSCRDLSEFDNVILVRQ